jgi:hypothetical protein
MKCLWVVLLVGILGLCGFSVLALEEKANIEFEPKTGDVEFDAVLGKLNLEAKGNINEFLTHLSISNELPVEKLEPLIIKEKMPPADVYMAVGISGITEIPIDKVIEMYKTNEGKGWGVIVKRLGIKPGSKEFHLLKQGGLTDLEIFKQGKNPGKPGKKPESPGKGKKK